MLKCCLIQNWKKLLYRRHHVSICENLYLVEHIFFLSEDAKDSNNFSFLTFLFSLFFSADSNYNNAIINTNVIVDFTGKVIWLSHGIYRSSCEISVEYFPFDIQTCKMMWSSWTYDGCSVRNCEERENKGWGVA